MGSVVELPHAKTTGICGSAARAAAGDDTETVGGVCADLFLLAERDFFAPRPYGEFPPQRCAQDDRRAGRVLWRDYDCGVGDKTVVGSYLGCISDFRVAAEVGSFGKGGLCGG